MKFNFKEAQNGKKHLFYGQRIKHGKRLCV